MRNITIFYDGSRYTFSWLKAMLWAENEFIKMGYKFQFCNIFQFLPLKNKVKSLYSCIKKNKFDLVMLAFHNIDLSKEQLISLVCDIKECSNGIIWMDTADSTGTTKFFLLPYVDLYLKKQLLKDFELYKNVFWADRIFSDYYKKEYNFQDLQYATNGDVIIDEFKDKVGLSYNLGLGDFFVNKYLCYMQFRQLHELDRVSPHDNKIIELQYRGTLASETVQFQRKLCMLKMKLVDGIQHNNPSVKLKYSEYIDELKKTQCVLSPFGWGEVCFRDFESFAYGCTLLKPSMEHMKTFPQFYVENETYISLDWSLNNFDDVVYKIKTDKNSIIKIAENGQDKYNLWRSDYGKIELAKHMASQFNKIN